jgi:TM2 domain-containing membrane protein YozV
MDNRPYDPREPQQQQQQQQQWQAPPPPPSQWQPAWQAPPQPMPPQYSQYQGQIPGMVMQQQKSWLATVLLCQFLGTLGVHRFYTGRIVSGIFQLLTFGGLGIWTLIDLIMIVTGDFTDSYNRPLNHPPVMGGNRSWTTTAFLCMFLGWLGVHRFYNGRVVSGIFMLLTGGGFGIWTLIDLIMIYTDSFTDDMGLLPTRMQRAVANPYMYNNAAVKG